MADKLGILTSGSSEPDYVSLSDNESEVLPSEALDNFKSDKNTLNEIISIEDQGITINDPGFVDLSSLTALKDIQPNQPGILKDIQPNQPGIYPIAASSVQFSADDKKSLENIIKKLVSVAHDHTQKVSQVGSNELVGSCSNYRLCDYFDCGSYNGSSDCDNNGKW